MKRTTTDEDGDAMPPEDDAPLFGVGKNTPGPARRDDPDTSKAAGESVEHCTGEQRTRVLAVMRAAGVSGLTDEQLCARLPEYRDSGTRTRRVELVRLGHVEDTGRTALTSTGRQSIVWRAKP